MEITGNKERKSGMGEVDGLICSMSSVIHKQVDNSATHMDGLQLEITDSVHALADLIRARYTIREVYASKVTMEPDGITSSSPASKITITKDGGITFSSKPKQAKLQSVETVEEENTETLRQETGMQAIKKHVAIALISEGKYDEAIAILESIGGRVPRKGEWKMDHAIEPLMEYAQIEAMDLKQEYASGEYGSVEECPSYEKIKAYADAINILLGYYAPDWGRKTPEGLAGIDSQTVEGDK